ncbi:MAG: hypothetical protein NWF00_12445 [Candidatus Bathyarchaeota archaeon]|nr:hypothetical protein [Candidatus Bathyarchaeota archaeon]
MVDKKDILKWSKKYDRTQGPWLQKEAELGAKFRKNRFLTCQDLAEVVEWKFKDQENKKNKAREAVAKNDEAAVERMSSQAFNIVGTQDAYRMSSLITINGVSPVLASVILAFFDPKNYAVFDVNVWKATLGNIPPNLFTAQNYLRLITALRKTANKHGLDARTVEKAFFIKSLER